MCGNGIDWLANGRCTVFVTTLDGRILEIVQEKFYLSASVFNSIKYSNIGVTSLGLRRSIVFPSRVISKWEAA
jgi:hypothetical protein